MNRVRRWISKSPNYFRSFGWYDGLRLLLAAERPLPKKSTIVRKYRLPGYHELYLRETISDHSIFWQCLVQGQYDFRRFPHGERVVSDYHAAIRNGIRPLIIDCGGNIGLSAVYLANLMPEAQICVLEPDRDNFELLKMNTSYLGSRLKALHGGIWNESTNLSITNPDAGSAAFRVSATEHPGGALRGYTIEDVCALTGVESPLIVKIDIEGAQAQLFKSNTGWVRNTHLIMLELDDWLLPWQGTSRAFFSCVAAYPFEYLISGETLFCFRDFEQSVIVHDTATR
jgi:FkbM family methyltransferase